MKMFVVTSTSSLSEKGRGNQIRSILVCYYLRKQELNEQRLVGQNSFFLVLAEEKSVPHPMENYR